jgi:hypothetical protein
MPIGNRITLSHALVVTRRARRAGSFLSIGLLDF